MAVEHYGVGESDQTDIVVVVRGVEIRVDDDVGAGDNDLSRFQFPDVVGAQDDLDVGFPEK